MSILRPRYTLLPASFEELIQALKVIAKNYLRDELAVGEEVLVCLLDRQNKNKITFLLVTNSKLGFSMFESKKSTPGWKWIPLSSIRSIATVHSIIWGWTLRYSIGTFSTLTDSRFIVFGKQQDLCHETATKLRKAVAEAYHSR